VARTKLSETTPSRKGISKKLIIPSSNDESMTSTSGSGLLAPPAVSSLEDQATCFFFNNYVLMQGAIQGYMEYLPILFVELPSSEALCAAISAVGIAGIANMRRSSEVMSLARSKYGSALRLTNAALTDRFQCKRDHTLMTVLILALYEVRESLSNFPLFIADRPLHTITCSTPQSMRTWSNHITGAMALIFLRGQHQLKHEVGLRLFSDLRDNLVCSGL
jgi:uncharacterized protein YsxB (DUF464 family)